MVERKEFLTAPEVMAHLQVGRTFVYEQARLYLATGGAQGLPCRRFGRLLRFPLDEIDRYQAPSGPAPVVELDAHRPATAAEPVIARTRSRTTPRRPTGTDQSTLPFTD